MKTESLQSYKVVSPGRISDELWDHIGPLLTVEKPRKKSGRPRRDDRLLLEGLIWLWRSGEQWAALPAEFGPKSTCHARFREWIESGALAKVWPLLISECGELAGLAAPWQEIDGALRVAPGKKGPAVLRRFPEASRTDEPKGDALA